MDNSVRDPPQQHGTAAPFPHSDATGPSSNIERRQSPEVLRHMLVSPMAVLESTAGRLLSVDSARLTKRKVREFNIELVKAQWYQKKGKKKKEKL